MKKTHLGVCLIEQVSVPKLESPKRREWQAESVWHPLVESVTYKDAVNFLFRTHKSELWKQTCTEITKILNCIAGPRELRMPVFMRTGSAPGKGYSVFLCPTRHRV